MKNIKEDSGVLHSTGLMHFGGKGRVSTKQTLQARRKWVKTNENLIFGDIVKICDERVRRGDWLIGRVVNVYPGDDGIV
jgi:hypothetical protein